MKPLWEGSISFGLILIPVKLYKATEDRKPVFHLVREKDMCPITYTKVCKATGEEVPFSEIVKSYEYRKGDSVILKDEDFKKAYTKRSENLEIMEFTDELQIQSRYYEQPYYIEPAKGAAKVYSLLREALKKTGKVGIAKYVLHNLEHLGVLKAQGDFLILNQIRFESEFRDPVDLNIPSDEKMADKEIALAVMLIDQLSAPFKPQDFRDTFNDEINKIIEEKIKTGKVNSIEFEETGKPAEVIDLMQKLKQSLKESKIKNVS